MSIRGGGNLSVPGAGVGRWLRCTLRAEEAVPCLLRSVVCIVP